MIKLRYNQLNFFITMFKEYHQDQNQLLPARLTDFISSDHTARLINQVIDQMDTSFIEKTYSFNGQRAYHPKMLLKVLVYGYTTGLRSSRKIADHLKEDIVMMWLSGRQTPDFRTISDFRKDKLGDFKKLFKQVLNLCQELGLIRIGKVCFDGTKIRADASNNRMLYRKVLERRRTRIDQQVEEIIKEAEALDKEEDKLYGNGTEHCLNGLNMEEIKKKLTKMDKRKLTLKKQENKLEAKKSDTNKRLRKMRKDRNTMNLTDKDATLMLMKEGSIEAAYNVQLATEHQVILGYGAYANRNDQKLLKPMVNVVKDNTGKKPEIIPADAGYGNKGNYRFLKNERITAFIPYNNFNKEMIERHKGVYELPKSPDVELERYKLRQRLRLLSPEGKALMKRRRQDIEPAIGDLKRNMNFRNFHLRGKPKCLIELGLVSLGHNLKKIKNHLKKLAKQDTGLKKARELGQVLGYLPS